MKILILFLCGCVTSIIITLFKEEIGIILGAIPVALLFAATMWLAEIFYKKWDKHKKATKVNSEPADTSSNILQDVATPEGICGEDNVVFCHKCGTRLSEGSQFCRKCGTDITNDIDTCHICDNQK